MSSCKNLYSDKKPFVIKGSFPLPFAIESTCPNCKESVELDFEDDDYGAFRVKINQNDKIWMWCQECDHEFEVPVRLNVSLEILK